MVGLLLVLDSFWLVSPTVSGFSPVNLSNYGVIRSGTNSTTSPIFKGVVIWGDQSMSYTATDYLRFQWMGVNSVVMDLWWSWFEPYPNQPGVWDTTHLSQLEAKIATLKSYGIQPFITLRIAYGDQSASYQGWSSYATSSITVNGTTTAAPALGWGADYVNFNQYETSYTGGTHGRTRYLNLLTMLATRYPDAGIIPWHFPYHAGNSHTVPKPFYYYTYTFPEMYSAIRSHGIATRPIVFMPLAQSLAGNLLAGEYGNSYNTYFRDYPTKFPDPNLLYGLNGHDPYYDVYNDRAGWDHNQAKLLANYQPAIDFHNTYHVPFASPEFAALTNAGGSVNPSWFKSRLDWMEAMLKILRDDLGDASFWYWRYSNPPQSESPYNSSGQPNQVAYLISNYTAG